jgi:hypothetical protein
LQHPGQNSLGDDFYFGVLANFGIQSHAITNGLARGFIDHTCHSMGSGFCRDSAWLQQQNFLTQQPGLSQECERDQGGFARTGWCLQYDFVMYAQAQLKFVQDIFNR